MLSMASLALTFSINSALKCHAPVLSVLLSVTLDGKTGILVPHGDIPAMAAALGRLAASPDTVRSLGEAGRTFAEQFTWDAAARQTEEHVLEVVRQGGSPMHREGS